MTNKTTTWIANVDSTMIRALAYNPKNAKLFIQFSNGIVFMYDDVPISEFEDFSLAESVGKYFHSDFKGEYEGSKLEASVG